MILIIAVRVDQEHIRQLLALSHALIVLQILVVVLLRLLVCTAQPFQMRFLQVAHVVVTRATQVLLQCQALIKYLTIYLWEALAQHVLLENTKAVYPTSY